MLVTAVLKVLINVPMSVSSASRMVSAANFPLIIAWKASATSGFFSFSRSNLIVAWPSFLTLFRCSFKVITTSSWSLPMSAPGKLRVLDVHTGPEALPYHDVVYQVVVLSVWAVPRGSSGCFVWAKGVRQHKVVVAGKFQEPSPVLTSIFSYLGVLVALHH